MAQGIFDFLQSEAAQPGLMALMLGGGQLGQLAGGLVQQRAMAEDRAAQRDERMLRQRLGNAQLANYQSEIDNRALASKKDARQQDLIASFLGGGAPGGQGAGFVQPGEVGGVPGGAAGILALAQQYGIPPQAIQADMAFNGGKGIAEMLAKHGGRDMQVANGYVFDKNRMGPGFLPSLNTTASGQSTVTHIGPNGQPIVSAPQGALDVYGAYKDVDNRSSARYTPGRPVIGPDNRTYGQSQLQEVGGGVPGAVPGRQGPTNAAEQGMAAQVAGVQIDPQREIAAVMRELPSITNPQDRAAALQYVQRLQAQAGAQAPAGASGATGALSFSPAEEAEQAAAKTRANNTAAADVVRDTNRQTDAKRSGQFLPTIDRAIALLKEGPTSSLVGVGVDAALGAFGKSTKGAELGEQLSALSGWLTSNVPRMEGPQSDRDAQNYAIMAGRVGDNSKPISVRLAAANEIRNLQLKYAGLNGIEVPGAGGGQASGEQSGQRNLVASLPPANGSNKGKRARDTETGKVYVSNGLQWKEE